MICQNSSKSLYVGHFNYKILKASASKKRIFDLICDFITAGVTNAELSEKIMLIARDKIVESPKKENITAYKYTACSSKSLLYDYLFAIGEKHLFGTEIDDILNFLEEKWLIHKDFTFDRTTGSFTDQEYLINSPMISDLHNANLLYCYLLGFEYSCEHFRNSVLKVEVSKKGVKGLGTGWIIDYITDKNTVRLLITNHHVIEDAEWIKIWDQGDHEIKYIDMEDFNDQGHDVAILEIERDKKVPYFTIASRYGILDEIVTLGYPRIPQAKDAFQVAHRGEINSIIDDYWGKKLLVISARTAPGNSGSPVINETGMVIGMVTKELFEKEDFTEKGITPYSACIPAEILLSLIDKSRIVKAIRN
jgi:hypothetical protein